MRANKPLLHGDITASIIDSLFDVHKDLRFGFREYICTREWTCASTVRWSSKQSPGTLDPDAQGQLFAGLAATNLEVGLVLHFGKKARFYRVFFEHRFKQRNQQCPSLPLPCRFSRPFNCRFPRTMPL